MMVPITTEWLASRLQVRVPADHSRQPATDDPLTCLSCDWPIVMNNTNYGISYNHLANTIILQISLLEGMLFLRY